MLAILFDLTFASKLALLSRSLDLVDWRRSSNGPTTSYSLPFIRLSFQFGWFRLSPNQSLRTCALEDYLP
jgi:hypothetical protein